jgi:hypothetical protein
MKAKFLFFISIFTVFIIFGCSEDDSMGPDLTPLDPDTAPKASIDRFSEDAGTLMIRSATNGLPAANVAVNFDLGEPFITKGLGPSGEHVQYYNFDVQPEESAPIFVLFKEGASAPVADQLNIINVIPGDDKYNDFWNVNKVTVPDDYKANSVTSYKEIVDLKYPVEQTNIIVNCPVVPEGSTASLRFNSSEDAGLTRGWYKDMVVFYFNFTEKALTGTIPTGGGAAIVPLSDIFVSFNINPDETGGGPASGFKTETGTAQTHNVVETIPSDADYSPLWLVNIYDNAAFANVSDWQSSQNAPLKATAVATVNCPIVTIE